MIRWLVTVSIAVLLCSSCEPKNETPASPSTQPTFTVGSPSPSTYEPVIMSLTQEAITGSHQKGKELLEEYQVQAGQTIRFPYGTNVFETHGDVPITSREEAQSKYPDWIIPEQLGDYVFQDLTLYRERTSVLFPDRVPSPKAELEVLEDKEPGQYFLCYENASGRFVVNVILLREDITSTELIPYSNPDYSTLPSCPNAWLHPADKENASSFLVLLMTVESNQECVFHIFKSAEADCLESESIPFTEEEARSIYTSIQTEFKR